MVGRVDGVSRLLSEWVLTLRSVAVGLTLGLFVSACARAGGETRSSSAAAVVDSVRSRDEELQRFRHGAPAPTGLGNSAPSMEVLLRRFVAAVERADTTALLEMALSRDEFGWLYYPTSRLGSPPYDLSPELYWYTVNSNGRTGLGRTLQDYGGRPLGFVRYACPTTPSIEGENWIYDPCEVTLVSDTGDTLSARLFGPIVERHGQFKFLNFASSFD